MIKSKLIELCIRSGSQNGTGIVDDLKRVSPRQAELICSNTYNDFLFLLLKDSESIDYFTKPYDNIPVVSDSVSGGFYSTLPVDVVQLPQNKGVHLIRPQKSSRKFIPATDEQVSLMEDSELKGFYDQTLYVLEGKSKVKYFNYDYTTSNVRLVHMKLIPSFLSYDWNSDVPIPSGKLSDFVGLVAKALYVNKKTIDTSSDGVS